MENTVNAIKWFNSLKDKHLMKLVMFETKYFYLSLTQDLLNKALNFASEYIYTYVYKYMYMCIYIYIYIDIYIYISKCDIDVIHDTRKSLLFDGSHTWIKKREGLFDVSMGAYDGAEVCKLVGTFKLNLLSKKYNKNDFEL